MVWWEKDSFASLSPKVFPQNRSGLQKCPLLNNIRLIRVSQVTQC